MKALKEIIPVTILFLITLQSYSQEVLERRKGTFNLTYKFNFTDDSKTKEYASNGQSILINRTFTIDRLLSLAPVLDYSYLNGYEKKHNFSLGGDAFFYPLHLISILKEEDYEPAKDNYFLSLGFYKTLNKGDVNSIFNMNFYVYTLSMGSQLKISPTIGASFYKRKEQEKEDLNFYNIGMNFRF
ncbi:hypothetical protein ACS126_03395 [Sphingobacterium lactis]|uniref:hypothetical protein n=1 Tax=Sphingobacterium TaxID=28453 RepID=UPI000ED0D3D1|nr:hypothetical protein [Sphingobacterium hotanense]MCT1525802.1 hypothetical protein [Sphingobacterium hotanense]HAP95086.1 hypothetical protein [Chryseobacterium sp.]